MGRAVRAFVSCIEAANEWAGRIASAITAVLVLLVTVEVVRRYVLNNPSIWGWDVTLILFASMSAMGAGYTLLHREHVAVDMLVSRFPARTRAIIDLVTSLAFFLGIGVLTWLAIGAAQSSIAANEHFTSVWEPSLIPLRIVWAVGVFLLLLQGVAKFIRDLGIISSGKERAS